MKWRVLPCPDGSWQRLGGAEDHIREEHDSACSEEIRWQVVGGCHTGSKHHQATCGHKPYMSSDGTIGTKILVLISEVFLFQGENIKLGLGQVS